MPHTLLLEVKSYINIVLHVLKNVSLSFLNAFLDISSINHNQIKKKHKLVYCVCPPKK